MTKMKKTEGDGFAMIDQFMKRDRKPVQETPVKKPPVFLRNEDEALELKSKPVNPRNKGSFYCGTPDKYGGKMLASSPAALGLERRYGGDRDLMRYKGVGDTYIYRGIIPSEYTFRSKAKEDISGRYKPSSIREKNADVDGYIRQVRERVYDPSSGSTSSVQGKLDVESKEEELREVVEGEEIGELEVKEEDSYLDGGLRAINREEIIVDPDGDSSSLCTACKIPIFSTPSISFSHGGEQLYLHNQCATMLPEHLVHELHPNHALVLLNHLHLPTPVVAPTCTNCREVCGTMFYQCNFSECDFRLDILCVSQIKIVHRSHHHSMMVIRQRDSSFITCSACDNKHRSSESESESEPESATVSYLCNLCSYWIHPDCASLPNAIVHYEHHQHSLFLTYNLPNASGSKCVICSMLKQTSGVYICLRCDDYVVHIRCALTRPKTFKPVFIRDAKVSDLARLPMPDENTSLIPYIRSSSGDNHNQENLHVHPLTLHEVDDEDESPRVCNACVQFVSPPFFSCSACPDFFLHNCCAHLPSEVDHRVHEHPLYLSSKAPKSDISGGFSCKGCGLRCNGFAYSCKSGHDYSMDVVCALINPAITHDSHDKTHILFMSRHINFSSKEICNCCNSGLSGICYECNICPKFKLHARCALLPITVSHYSFDKHLLQLTTTAATKRTATTTDDGDDEICEVCEELMEKKHWHYSCSECDQSFHIDCIPSVDQLSRIKLGSTIFVDGHGCAPKLVREAHAICVGRCCGVCGEVLKSSDDGLAYECSNCFFGIHHKCAKNSL